ncbi:MAG: 6-phosphogluconolactonase [Usitatibacter sp.]
MSAARWIGVADAAALRQAAGQRVLDAAARALERHGRFVIVLAGGETPRGVYTLLRSADTDWSRWEIWFGDERCLQPTDPARNSRMAADAWLDHVPIPQSRVHVIPGELGARAAALAYAQMLGGVGDFDLVLLGLGEDGHTASLFPGRDRSAGPSEADAFAVLDAPKPPRQRVSLSAARLSRSREVLFLVEGDAKREAVSRWRAGADIPARAIRPPSGVDVLLEASLLGAALRARGP